jgi:uncharacterized RDD family membrane protein YckC
MALSNRAELGRRMTAFLVDVAGIILTGMIGFFLVFGVDRRALHDKISGAAVAPRSVPV